MSEEDASRVCEMNLTLTPRAQPIRAAEFWLVINSNTIRRLDRHNGMGAPKITSQKELAMAARCHTTYLRVHSGTFCKSCQMPIQCQHFTSGFS